MTVNPSTLTAQTLKGIVEKGGDVLLVNILPTAEFEKQHIPGSVSVPADSKDLLPRVLELVKNKKDRRVILYGTSKDAKGTMAIATSLMSAGFTDVHRYEGGIDEWQRLGFPVESAMAAGANSK